MSSKLKKFTVHGPFEVPLEPEVNGKMVAKELTPFWKSVGPVGQQRGVYVFGIRAGRGITPIYVGKAAKQPFRSEVFGHHKLAAHYNPALLRCKKGKPVMFFVAHPAARGPINQKIINQMERFFISVAEAKNPSLSNVHGKREHKWRIPGVIRSGQGEWTKASRAFRSALGLN